MILNDLLSILRGDEPLMRLGTDFSRMLELVEEMFCQVNVGLWSGTLSDELIESTFKRDIQLNKLERSARKEVLNHLATRKGQGDLPYCFVLINVVKDAERIGDYVKNLVELWSIAPLPEDDTEERSELRALGLIVEGLTQRLKEEFHASNSDGALEQVRQAKDVGRRADALIERIATSGRSSQETTVLVLMARYYKRIASHAGNILSSVIMPLHKIDYLDEKELF